MKKTLSEDKIKKLNLSINLGLKNENLEVWSSWINWIYVQLVIKLMIQKTCLRCYKPNSKVTWFQSNSIVNELNIIY